MFVLGLTVLIFAVLLRWAATVGKVVILDPKGCTISFMGYRKHYLWSEFAVKRIEDFQNAHEYKQQSAAGAIFLKRPFRRPRWMGPGTFCMLKAPLSSFFVCFDSGHAVYPNPYVVDKASFLETLAQWGIPLEGK